MILLQCSDAAERVLWITAVSPQRDAALPRFGQNMSN